MPAGQSGQNLAGQRQVSTRVSTRGGQVSARAGSSLFRTQVDISKTWQNNDLVTLEPYVALSDSSFVILYESFAIVWRALWNGTLNRDSPSFWIVHRRSLEPVVQSSNDQ